MRQVGLATVALTAVPLLRPASPVSCAQLIRPTFEQILGDLELMVAKLHRDNADGSDAASMERVR